MYSGNQLSDSLVSVRSVERPNVFNLVSVMFGMIHSFNLQFKECPLARPPWLLGVGDEAYPSHQLIIISLWWGFLCVNSFFFHLWNTYATFNLLCSVPFHSSHFIYCLIFLHLHRTSYCMYLVFLTYMLATTNLSHYNTLLSMYYQLFYLVVFTFNYN